MVRGVLFTYFLSVCIVYALAIPQNNEESSDGIKPEQDRNRKISTEDKNLERSIKISEAEFDDFEEWKALERKNKGEVGNINEDKTTWRYNKNEVGNGDKTTWRYNKNEVGNEDKTTWRYNKNEVGNEEKTTWRYNNNEVGNINEVNFRGWWSRGVHNLTVGYKAYQDRLLYSASFYKPSRYWRVVEQNVLIKSPHNERISFIEAYDTHPDASSAGYASIIRNGVGYRNVTIHLESARSHGLKYYVRVFGHY